MKMLGTKVISSKEAKQLHGYDGPEWKEAVITMKCGGTYCRFKKGERVLVRYWRGWSVQRRTWRGSMVPLAQVCAGVPRKCFTITKKK